MHDARSRLSQQQLAAMLCSLIISITPRSKQTEARPRASQLLWIQSPPSCSSLLHRSHRTRSRKPSTSRSNSVRPFVPPLSTRADLGPQRTSSARLTRMRSRSSTRSSTKITRRRTVKSSRSRTSSLPSASASFAPTPRYAPLTRHLHQSRRLPWRPSPSPRPRRFSPCLHLGRDACSSTGTSTEEGGGEEEEGDSRGDCEEEGSCAGRDCEGGGRGEAECERGGRVGGEGRGGGEEAEGGWGRDVEC